MEVLSTGEKKAFYVLNIIFEIQVRIKAAQNTVLIVDDIADSFDYRNKYAIIRYLKDISDDSHFNQIILTHNFDFFRTINSRFVSYPYCLMASKDSTGIKLNKAAGIQNVFVNDWKPKFFTDPKKMIASIPFMRTLIEFTRGDQDQSVFKLTSLLHWKSDSAGITEAELVGVYNSLFGGSGSSEDGTKPVVELIHQHAKAYLTATAGINFEHKIVLSIAIRLQAEKYMVDKINDPAFAASIKSNQTPKLLAEFKKRHSADDATIRTIERVILMTPENIHLNSFMYEPILDMSDEEADRDRREGGEPRTLCRLPESRGRHPPANVPRDFAADRGTTAAATTSAGVRHSMVMHSRVTDGRSASQCQGKWPDQHLDHRSGCPRCR